jgi:hypothetical protein
MGGLFNPLTGAVVNKRNPFFQSAYGLANQNQLSFDFLFENLKDYLIRSLSSVTAGQDNYSNGGLIAPLDIQLVPGKSYIYLKYFRLAASREIPSIQRCHAWKPMISLAPAMPTSADEAHIEEMADNDQSKLVFKGKQRTYFPAIGRDFQTVENGLRVRSVAASDDVYEVTFENIAYPMPPAALMFCAQQDSEGYSNARHNDLPASRCVQNRDCNMSIEAIELTVNTSDKVLHYSADTTNQLDRRRLFESTSKNWERNPAVFQGRHKRLAGS